LQLKLDDAGVNVTPSPPRSAYGKMSPRVKRARTGLIVNSVILGVGVALWVGGAVHDARNPPPDAFSLEIPNGLIVAGATLTMVGSTGMIVSGAVLGVRKRKLRRLHEELYGTPRRVQWDLAQSRLVF
jgi:phosphate/sulfate permease